jgi:2',3'-cyclic-nucleotide 2'-phosphodiesterase/3'-nucleotidase
MAEAAIRQCALTRSDLVQHASRVKTGAGPAAAKRVTLRGFATALPAAMLRHLVLLIGLIGLAAGSPSAGAQQLKLRILETSDIHMSLMAWDYYQDKPVEDYGLERTATLIKAARAESKNTLLFDNGDLLQGNPLGDYIAKVKPLQPGQVHPAFKVMNALGYDAGNIGNHDFNYGLGFLRQSLTGAAYPYVNANIVIDDGKGKPEQARNAFTPYVILTRSFTDETGAQQTLKIGVLGFAPPQVMQWDRSNLRGKVAALDIPATARRLIPRIRAEGAAVVVVIAHSGFERGETAPFAENTVARLAEIPGVDAILFGHSHGEFPGRFFSSHPKVDLARGTINGVPATMPGFWGSHLGVIDLVLTKSGSTWQVTDSHAELRPVYDRAARKSLAAPDPAVAALIKTEHEGTLAYVRAEVAHSAVAIQSYFAQVADDPSVQLVANAQLAYGRKSLAGTPYAQLPLLSAAAPFKTGGRGGANNYTDIPAGPIAVRNVADLYVYPNTVKVVKLTGAQVREWLEFSAGAFNTIDPQGPAEQNLLNPGFPSYNFDTLDGVSYRYDLTQPARYNRDGVLVAPAAHRVVDLRYQNQPIAEQADFAVVTNNYRASGGGNFPTLNGSLIILDAPDENRVAVLQYLQATQPVNPSADGNWSIVPVAGVKLRFVSGSGGIAHLARHPQISLVKDNGDGTALFELKTP